MDNEKKAKNRTSIFQKFKNLKNKEIIIAAVLGCIALIIFFSNFTGSGSSSSDSSGGTFSTEEYVTNLENKLSKILTKVDGAGKVSVMITVESGMEIVTATESGSEKPIIVNGKVVIL